MGFVPDIIDYSQFGILEDGKKFYLNTNDKPIIICSAIARDAKCLGVGTLAKVCRTDS